MMKTKYQGSMPTVPDPIIVSEHGPHPSTLVHVHDILFLAVLLQRSPLTDPEAMTIRP